eukprot:5159323-Prorocentrum_lima.AAC.1
MHPRRHPEGVPLSVSIHPVGSVDGFKEKGHQRAELRESVMDHAGQGPTPYCPKGVFGVQRHDHCGFAFDIHPGLQHFVLRCLLYTSPSPRDSTSS